MDDAAYEALMARLNEAYPSQPVYTPADVKLQSGQITRQQGQDPVMLMNPRTLQQGESNPIDFDQSGGIGQLGAMINAGRLRGMLDMSAQDGMTPGYNAMGTMQLPEGYSASYRRSNEIGGLGDAQNAIMLAKQFGEPNTPSPSLSAGASRSGMNGHITYDLSGSVPLTTGRNPEAPQFRLPSSREEQPMVPPSRRDRERQPSRQEVKGAATAGLSHSPRDHSTRANAGLKFNFADGGHVDAALHLLRHHLAGGGFLSDLFSGPDYLSTGEVASPTNWGDPESAADFFKADRALRLAREVQAREPEAAPLRQVQERPPVEALRQQIAAPAPAPTPEQAPVNIPYAAPSRPMRLQGANEMPPHLTEQPGFGQSQNTDEGNDLWANPKSGTGSYLEDYKLPTVALARQIMAQQEAIPSAAEALAAVENLHNAGVYSGPELEKAGEILAAHNRAKADGIPVEEALRLNRPAPAPLAYASTPAPAPASAAIDTATGKLTNRVDPNSDAERAGNVWTRMLKQESGNRQFDRSGRTITSPAGALGISQVMPSTGPEAAGYAGLPWDLNRLRTDPEYNHALGRAYYDAQLARFGDPVLAAAAYNGGPGRVAGALRQAQATGRPWTDFLKPETQNYVRVVGRADGGLVDDALHVVREHHADGEAVGQGPEAPTPEDAAVTIARRQPLTPASLARAWTTPEEAIEADVGPRARTLMETYPVAVSKGIAAMPGAVAHSIQDPFELAHQAATNQLPPDYFHSNEGISRALNAAGLAQTGGLGGASARAGETVLGAGPVRKVGMGHNMPPPDETFNLPQLLQTEKRRGVDVLNQTADLAGKDPKFSKFGAPLSDLEATISRKNDLVPYKSLSPEQLYREGAYIAPALGDLTGAGYMVHEINGIPLSRPVDVTGGGEYMRSAMANAQGQESAWASRPSTAQTMLNKINNQVPEGAPVYMSHTLMGVPSMDSSHMVMQGVLRQIPHLAGKIDPVGAMVVDDFIRSHLPAKAQKDWPGILNADAAEAYLMGKPGTWSSTVVKALDKSGAVKAGFPDVGATRFAMMEPRLAAGNQLSSGFALSRLDPGGKLISNPMLGHETYAGKMPSIGGYAGGFENQIPMEKMFSDWFKGRPANYTEEATGLIKPTTKTMHQQAMMTQVPVQKATQQWLDTVMNHMRQNPQKWGYSSGGLANP